MRDRWLTWTIGGSGLIASGVAVLLRDTVLGTPAAHLIGTAGNVFYAAAVLFLAFGLSREASIVARRPLGVAALTCVGLWPLVASVLSPIFESSGIDGDTGPLVYFYLALFVPSCAGVIAVVQIARAGVIPPPWQWAPSWALGVGVAAFVIPQVTYLALPPTDIQGFADLFALFGSVAALVGTLGLGILALVLAAKQRPESVDVFRST